MFTSFQVTGSHDEGKEAGRQDPKRPGSETKFYQPAESAGKNPLAAGKNKKNGHIWYDLVRFGAIYCDLLVLFQKPPHSISWIYFFWRYLALFGVSPDWAGLRPNCRRVGPDAREIHAFRGAAVPVRLLATGGETPP
jgi:hypothetical protein